MKSEDVILIIGGLTAIGAAWYFSKDASDGSGGGGSSINIFNDGRGHPTDYGSTDQKSTDDGSKDTGTGGGISRNSSLAIAMARGDYTPTQSQLQLSASDVLTAAFAQKKSGGATGGVSLNIAGANKIANTPIDKSGNVVTATSPQSQEVKKAATAQATKNAVKYLDSFKKYF